MKLEKRKFNSIRYKLIQFLFSVTLDRIMLASLGAHEENEERAQSQRNCRSLDPRREFDSRRWTTLAIFS